MSGMVVSATTSSISVKREADVFLEKAEALVVAAEREWAEGNLNDALEFGYQAALRLAGSRVVAKKEGKKSRRCSGVTAWERFASVDALGADQAATFSGFSGVRSRVLNRIESEASEDTVRALLSAVRNFLDVVERERGWLSPAA